MALMLNHVPMIRLLMDNNAIENPNCILMCLNIFLVTKCIIQFYFKVVNCEDRYNRICNALAELEMSLKTKKELSLLNTEELREYDSKLTVIDEKIKLFNRMKSTYESAERPEAPLDSILRVDGPFSILVNFEEPVIASGALVTKYKSNYKKY